MRIYARPARMFFNSYILMRGGAVLDPLIARVCEPSVEMDKIQIIVVQEPKLMTGFDKASAELLQLPRGNIWLTSSAE